MEGLIVFLCLYLL